ncbi:M56 family metallopeptidase [Flavonifractor plautii]|nr:M56 family metallopeptidase [Flavonifractor plautii]MDB7903279.1 M56 family metallopeptidase [Flavonifractor plautii]MDB7920573.1 M56 family metallopeptidase [Flavonifractor plautii]MDB7944421.1 M56 family metallopeptidase [Flavonifractor plautii]MDS9665960.1 M56 family metallopeptidase [Flavonifractor plautii]
MTELFLTVLQMSLMAAGVTVIALPLRWLFRRLRLPALACVLLWLVVAVRMLLPVGLVTGPFSVLGWLTPAVQEQTEALARTEEIVLLPAVPDPAPPAAPDPGFALPEAVPAPEEAAPAAEGLSVLDVLAWLWLAGVLAVWGYMALAWLRLRRRLATAVWRGSAQMGWWWESDRIPTAFVFGFFTPRVYVPAGLEGETLRWVLLHERAHIKLGHHRYKAVYFLLAGLHWFNPMLWLSWVLLGRDLEVACDEKVLGSACGSPREYSAALLALASPNRGPLLPPGFGETGVKDRIRRALKWKPAAPWMAAVLFVLAVALGLLLLNDPPFPDPTVNGQYPTLRIQMEQDGPGGAGGETVVNMGVPEAATWPEELPEAERTASTPRPWVSLYLDNGAFPSRWTMTEYLVENGQAVRAREVGLSPYGAGNGWLLRLESREDAPGAGMETRLYVLSCTWQEGIRTHELEYAFRLNLPSVPPGPLTEPVVVAGDTRVDLDGDASATAAMGSFLHITIPDNVVSYALAGQGADGGSTGQGGESLSSGGGGSIGVRLEYLGGRAPGASSDQTQHYTLTYTWADGTTESRAFTLYAYTPRPEWDDEGLRIRYPGDTEWTELDTLIPVPAEWAGQDLAGRDEAESLEGLLSGTGGMSDGLNGWFVFAIGHGVGGADTYVYRTRDGGRTWQETGRPDLARMMWYPSYTYFIDSYTGFLGQSYFNDAPIFRTTDGGLTWEEITLPLAGEWELSSMCASGSDVLMLLTGCGSNSLSNAVLYSGDRGETWERLALPADASGWQTDAVRLLGELPENGIALYGLNPKATGLDGLLVAWDGVLACFPSLSYDTGPQAVPAQLALEDYDGDGADELAAMLCTGTGTGVNVWSLYVFEQDGRALTLGGMLDADDVAAAELGLPAGRYVGSQVYFGTEGDGLRIFLGVTDDRGLNDIGELTGAVRYDGQTLSLNPAELTYQEIA